MAFVRAASAEDLEEGGILQVELDGREFVLCRIHGEIRAFEGLCPHRNGPLGHGNLCNGRIVCPWHAWEFDATSGAYDYDPSIQLKQYPARSNDGEITIDIEAGA